MISVALATYNGEKYIKRQVESVLANLQNEDELIVSDDGSTDNTLKILENFHDKRIKVYQGPKLGINKNFENAINQCMGELIFLCDQDDYWHIGKVDKIKKIFDTRDCNLVIHDARVIDEHGNIQYPSFFEHRRMRSGILKNMLRNCYHGCLMAFRGNLKKHIIPIPYEGCLHDQWIGLIAELYGKPVFYKEVLMDYIRHGDNASSFEHHLPFHRQVSDRIILFNNIRTYKKERFH